MTTQPDHGPDLFTRALLLREITLHMVIHGDLLVQLLDLDPAVLTSHRQALLDTGVVQVLDESLLYVNSTDERQARALYAQWTGEDACQRCGCTETWGCEEGCDWASPGLCTACAERA